MALLSREFIAVPDDKKNQLVFKWPDQSIRRFTRAIVNADELAIFVNTGQIAATMGPGRHQIDADEIPGLGILIDAATGGRAYRAELYFVANREFTGFTFGGRVDDVQDPQTGLIVTLRVFGDYALRVTDPIKLILNLVGTLDVTDNRKISDWVSDQMLKVLRTDITTQIVRNGWPILGLSVYSPEIEAKVIENANNQLNNYGVAITRMGNFDVNLAEEDQPPAQGAGQGHQLFPTGRWVQQLRGRADGPGRRRRHGPGRWCDPGRVPRSRDGHGPAGWPVPGTAAAAAARIRRWRRGRLRRPAAGRIGAATGTRSRRGHLCQLPDQQPRQCEILPGLRQRPGPKGGPLHRVRR